MTAQDKAIVRELAKQFVEIASSEKQQKANRRMKDTNDLKLTRPPVLLDELPWYQLNIDDELTCLAEDARVREVEELLRRNLYRARHFKADATFEPVWRVRMAYDNPGLGFERSEDILRTDAENAIVSHKFHDVLADEAVLDAAPLPTFTLRPDLDEERVNFLSELFGDSMPVLLVGHSDVYFPVWDRIAFLRGVEPILIDMYDRPEYLHRIMKKYTEALEAELAFIEANLPVDPVCANLHCTPGYISGLAADGFKATWFRGMAQMFASVSPEMLEEFEIHYIKPIAERCAYTYYGCCEPLDGKLDVLMKIRNLRKISVSPWAKEEVMAERMGGKYVYCRKPNPAFVALTSDPVEIRRETENTVKLCQKYGCPCEFILKDISTVSHKPENLFVWTETVSRVLDEAYGEV